MRLSVSGVAAIALVGLSATLAPLRADEQDCETVISDLNDTIGIATKNFEAMLDELKKLMSQSSDDKTKATVKNRFCSASGELLGTTRATRAVAGVCGPTQTAALNSLDKSIGEIESAIAGTCK